MSSQLSSKNLGNQFKAAEWIKQGDRLLGDKKFTEAVEAYTQAIQLQPNSAPHHSRLGNALVKQKQFEAAEQCFQKAVKLNPESHLGLYGLAQVAVGQNQWNKAIELYQQLVELKPGFLAAVYQEWGAALSQLRQWEEAANVFRQLVQIHPEAWQAYYQLGEVLESLEQWDEAIEVYSKLSQKAASYPGVPEKLRFLAYRRNAISLTKNTTEAITISSVNDWTRSLKITEGISIFTCCMNRNSNLRQAIGSWLACKAIDEIVIVDWNSKEPVSSTLADIEDTRILILRVVNQEKWVLSYAFNLAARLTSRTKILKLDADIEIQPNFPARNILTEKTFLAGNWRSTSKDQAYINGCFYLYRDAFFEVNGFNEWITTYGWDDTDIYQRLEEKGCRRVDIDPASLKHLEHAEEDRLRHQIQGNSQHGFDYLRQSTIFNNRKNRFIAFAMPWNQSRTLLDFRVTGKPKRELICEQISEHCQVPTEIIFDAEAYTAKELLSRRLGLDVLSLNRNQVQHLIENKKLESITKLDILIAKNINAHEWQHSLILSRGSLASEEFIYCIYLILVQTSESEGNVYIVNGDTDKKVLDFIKYLSNSRLLVLPDDGLNRNSITTISTSDKNFSPSEASKSGNLIINLESNAVERLASQTVLTEQDHSILLKFGKGNKSLRLLVHKDLQYRPSLYHSLLTEASKASSLQACRQEVKKAIRFAQFQTVQECYRSINSLLASLIRQSRENDRKAFEDWLQKELKFYNRPVVTIATSIFKGDEYIEHFLADMTQQTMFGRCELILINPNSPDNEEPVIKKYMERFKNIKYKRLDHDPGLYDCWNIAIMMGSGEYITNANLDDRRAPQHLEVLVSALDEESTADVASSALYVTSNKNESWKNNSAHDVWFMGFPKFYGAKSLFVERNGQIISQNIAHCMPVWRRRLHDRFGYFDEHTYGTSCDWEFWLRCAVQGASFMLIGQPLGLYLENPVSHNRRFSNKEVLEQKIINEYCKPLQNGETLQAYIYRF